LYIPDWLRDGDFIGAAFGSLLGFVFAYIILKLQFNQEAKREASRKSEEDLSYFHHCRQLLQKSLKGWKKTRDSYNALAHAYDEKPCDDHPHPLSINVSQRTLEHMDRIRILDACIHLKGRTVGRAMGSRLQWILDFYGYFIPVFEAGIIALKGDIEHSKKCFDSLQFELCLQMQNQLIQLYRDGRREEAVSKRIVEILNHTQSVAKQAGGPVSISFIHTELVQKVLGLRGQGLPGVDTAPPIALAMRAEKEYNRVSTKAQELTAFADKRVREMELRIAKAERLLFWFS
jgi:hypothetical protein